MNVAANSAGGVVMTGCPLRRTLRNVSGVVASETGRFKSEPGTTRVNYQTHCGYLQAWLRLCESAGLFIQKLSSCASGIFGRIGHLLGTVYPKRGEPDGDK